MGNVASPVVYGRYFGYSGGQSIYAVGNVTDAVEEETETTPQDAVPGIYKLWFVSNDPDWEDTDGLDMMQWNLKNSGGSGFTLPNTAMITVRLSISGEGAADLNGIVDRVEWDWKYDSLDSKNVVNIVDYSNSSPSDLCSEKIFMVNAKAAGFVVVTFTMNGYRKNASGGEEAVIRVSRSLVIGSPLQIYDSVGSSARTYSIFDEQTRETTIYANNADTESSRVFWYFVDAEGRYEEAGSQILLENPDNLGGKLATASKIVEQPEQSGSPVGEMGSIKAVPYRLKAGKSGGFTRLVGRIYLDGDSASDRYMECTYDVINAARFNEATCVVEGNKKTLRLNYGDTRSYRILANHNDSLGWTSYSSRSGVLSGVTEQDVVELGAAGITAQNYGTVVLEATSVYKEWEHFNFVAEQATDLLEVFVSAAILKGNTVKSVVDTIEVISVGGTIPLSTNVVGNQYTYKWEYLIEGGVETGNATAVASSWKTLGPSVSDSRFSVIESTAGASGITSLTIQGKTSGSVRMRCTVIDRTGERVLEETFTLKIVDTMTLSETRKVIAVGEKFDIEAFISGLAPGASVKWSVVDSEYVDHITISEIGSTTATVIGERATDGRYIECRASVEINGITTSAAFYVMALPAIDGVRIEVSPSRVISVGGSAALDLIIDPDVATSFTKDQIKWVVKDFVFQDGTSIDASTIIRKEDSTSNVLQTTVTGLAPGEAYVVAVINDSAQTEIAVITIKVVTKVEGLQLNKKEHTLYLPSGNEDAQNRSTFLLIATPLPKGVADSEELGIEWYASNNTVTVTPDPENPMQALVTAHAIGSVQVMANVAGLPAIADFCTFTVENPAEEIQLDPAGPYQLRVGETRLVTPVLTPAEVTNTSVIWTIENEQIATVSQSGVITGVSFGSTFVTCTTSNGISIQYPVTVFDSAQTVVPAVSGAKIKASPSSVISVGDTVQLDLILDITETSLTKDQIKWVVKGVDGQGDPETIIEKTDGDNLFQTTITGRSVGEVYVAAVINDSVQTEIAITTIKVLPNVKAIELNTHEVKGKLSESVVLTATIQPKGYADIKNLKMEWIGIPENGSITITPDPNDPLKAVVTFYKAGTVYVMAQVSDMPRIADLCKFEILSARPSNNKDKENENSERNNTTNQNTASDSDLTNSEQNRVEAALGSHIVIQTVVKNNAGKLVVTVGREVVFCEKDGSLSKEKWQSIDGVWYYFGSDSKAVDGWLKTGNQWYYMNQNNKQMETGWIQTADGKWYLLDERNGDMQTGWQQRGGKWYLLDGINGDMKTDWQLKDGKWYLLDRMNGDMKIGWQMVNGKWYYLTESGAMAANTITPDGYQVDGSGVWIP